MRRPGSSQTGRGGGGHRGPAALTLQGHPVREQDAGEDDVADDDVEQPHPERRAHAVHVRPQRTEHVTVGADELRPDNQEHEDRDDAGAGRQGHLGPGGPVDLHDQEDQQQRADRHDEVTRSDRLHLHVVVGRVGVGDRAVDRDEGRLGLRDVVQVPGDARHDDRHAQEGDGGVEPRLAPGDQGHRDDERRSDQDPGEGETGVVQVADPAGDLDDGHGFSFGGLVSVSRRKRLKLGSQITESIIFEPNLN